MWDEHSLKISAPYLFRFGIDSVWKIFEIKDHSLSDRGDCRTAPATPGLLKRRKRLNHYHDEIPYYDLDDPEDDQVTYVQPGLPALGPDLRTWRQEEENLAGIRLRLSVRQCWHTLRVG